MKQSKNNNLQDNLLEQVAGGNPLEEFKAVGQEVIKLSEQLSGVYEVFEQALEGFRLRTPGSGAVIRQCQNDIARLQAQISEKLQRRSALLKELGQR